MKVCPGGALPRRRGEVARGSSSSSAITTPSPPRNKVVAASGVALALLVSCADGESCAGLEAGAEASGGGGTEKLMLCELEADEEEEEAEKEEVVAAAAALVGVVLDAAALLRLLRLPLPPFPPLPLAPPFLSSEARLWRALELVLAAADPFAVDRDSFALVRDCCN